MSFPPHASAVPDSDVPHMVTRNGMLHCTKCELGSEYLVISRSFADTSRLKQYRAFAAKHLGCESGDLP